MSKPEEVKEPTGTMPTPEAVDPNPQTKPEEIAKLTASLYDEEVKPASEPGTPEKPSVRDEAYLASQICLHWNKQFDSIIEVGRLLNEAGGIMSTKNFHKFVKKLPFTYSVAQRLRKLAKSECINDPKNRPFLPASWNTLSAIDNLNDFSNEAFQRGKERGIIHSNCQFKDIKKLRKEAERVEAKRAAEQGAAAAASTDSQSSELRSGSHMQQLKRKAAEINAKLGAPQPLFIWMVEEIVEANFDKWTVLVEELNRRLPLEYPFISEVKVRK